MMRVGITSAVSVMLAVAVVVSTWPDASGRLTGATAQAQQPGEPHEESSAFSESSMNAATVAKLEKIGSVNFVETELGEVLPYFVKLGGFQIYLDRKSLEENDLGSDTLVSISLRDVPIEMLLRKMLEPLELTYMLDHGVVIITSREVEASNREIRVYRVDDLVRAADKIGLPDAAAVPAGRSANHGVAAHIRLVQGMGSERPSSMKRKPSGDPDMDAIIGLIIKVVEPESWAEMGGNGVIAEYRGVLVITQTTRNQMKVEKLLKELREAIPAETKEPTLRQTGMQGASLL